MLRSIFVAGWARAASAVLLGLLLAAGRLSGTAIAAPAATVPAAAATSDTAAQQVELNELLTLLAQRWLSEQGAAKGGASTSPESDVSFVEWLNSSATSIHDQFVELIKAIPRLPDEFRTALDHLAGLDRDFNAWWFVILGATIVGAE